MKKTRSLKHSKSITHHLTSIISRFTKKKISRIPQDIIGNIVLLKFPKKTLKIIKFLKARKFLKSHPHVTTVLEKTEKFSGPLRTLKTSHLAGIKTKIATYRENDCTFNFNVDKSYFSPRLSNERKIIADQIVSLVPKTKNQQPTTEKSKPFRILVMFAGVSPYPITIARKLHLQKKKATIISNELNKEANKDSLKNIKLNKLQKYIALVNGDAKNLPKLLAKPPKSKNQQPTTNNQQQNNAFDIILMPRPNLPDTFLKTALKLSKKGTTIFYHGFGTKESVLNEIKKDTKGKIGKITIRKAGDIGPYIFRWQAIFKVK